MIVGKETQSEYPLKGIDSPEENIPINNQSKWLNNNDEEVENIFGFSESAELVNGRAAMVGFLMLLITEFIYNGEPVTKKLFGIG